MNQYYYNQKKGISQMNEIIISGCVKSEPIYTHEMCGEKFYRFMLESTRISGTSDTVLCDTSVIFKDAFSEGSKVEIVGEVRTRNFEKEDGRRGCEVYVFVKEVNEYSGRDINEVYIDGYICKEPIYRTTPSDREICDLLIANNRERSRKSNYIPCIAWGRHAQRMAGAGIGDKLECKGRLQSREYTKVIDEDNKEIKVAYEVSIATIKECE